MSLHDSRFCLYSKVVCGIFRIFTSSSQSSTHVLIIYSSNCYVPLFYIVDTSLHTITVGTFFRILQSLPSSMVCTVSLVLKMSSCSLNQIQYFIIILSVSTLSFFPHKVSFLDRIGSRVSVYLCHLRLSYLDRTGLVNLKSISSVPVFIDLDQVVVPHPSWPPFVLTPVSLFNPPIKVLKLLDNFPDRDFPLLFFPYLPFLLHYSLSVLNH